MAHTDDKVGFPNIPLSEGMSLVLRARDPSNDADVAGVTATRWAIYGDKVESDQIPDAIPLYTPEDVSA